MAGNLVWLRNRETGETYLELHPVRLSGPEEPSTDGAFMLRKQDIPATNVRLVELPSQGSRAVLHPAPRRQFVILLQGELDVAVSDGSHYRLLPGDWLFADDVNSRGHRVENVGEENLVTVQLAVPSDWEWPESLPS